MFFWKSYYTVQYGKTSKREYFNQITCELNFSSSSRSSQAAGFLNVVLWPSMAGEGPRGEAFLVHPAWLHGHKAELLQLSHSQPHSPVSCSIFNTGIFLCKGFPFSSYLHTNGPSRVRSLCRNVPPVPSSPTGICWTVSGLLSSTFAGSRI